MAHPPRAHHCSGYAQNGFQFTRCYQLLNLRPGRFQSPFCFILGPQPVRPVSAGHRTQAANPRGRGLPHPPRCWGRTSPSPEAQGLKCTTTGPPNPGTCLSGGGGEGGILARSHGIVFSSAAGGAYWGGGGKGVQGGGPPPPLPE